MTLPVQTQFTLEQYFDLEYQAPTRHEFVDGKMRTMSYTSEEHGLIISNLGCTNKHKKYVDFLNPINQAS